MTGHKCRDDLIKTHTVTEKTYHKDGLRCYCWKKLPNPSVMMLSIVMVAFFLS